MAALYYTYEVSEDEYELEKLEDEIRQEPTEEEEIHQEKLIFEEHQNRLHEWEQNIQQVPFLYRFRLHNILPFGEPQYSKNILAYFDGLVDNITLDSIRVGVPAAAKCHFRSEGSFWTRKELKIIFEFADRWLTIEDYDNNYQHNLCWMAANIMRNQLEF
jgi:hypothetical protein